MVGDGVSTMPGTNGDVKEPQEAGEVAALDTAIVQHKSAEVPSPDKQSSAEASAHTTSGSFTVQEPAGKVQRAGGRTEVKGAAMAAVPITWQMMPR